MTTTVPSTKHFSERDIDWQFVTVFHACILTCCSVMMGRTIRGHPRLRRSFLVYVLLLHLYVVFSCLLGWVWLIVNVVILSNVKTQTVITSRSDRYLFVLLMYLDSLHFANAYWLVSLVYVSATHSVGDHDADALHLVHFDDRLWLENRFDFESCLATSNQMWLSLSKQQT